MLADELSMLADELLFLSVMCVGFGFVFNLKDHLWTVFVPNVNFKSFLYIQMLFALTEHSILFTLNLNDYDLRGKKTLVSFLDSFLSLFLLCS